MKHGSGVKIQTTKYRIKEPIMNIHPGKDLRILWGNLKTITLETTALEKGNLDFIVLIFPITRGRR